MGGAIASFFRVRKLGVYKVLFFILIFVSEKDLILGKFSGLAGLKASHGLRDFKPRLSCVFEFLNVSGSI